MKAYSLIGQTLDCPCRNTLKEYKALMDCRLQAYAIEFFTIGL